MMIRGIHTGRAPPSSLLLSSRQSTKIMDSPAAWLTARGPAPEFWTAAKARALAGRCSCSVSMEVKSGTAWMDEFSSLEDRCDLDPVPLPTIVSAKRVVIVRHGQSTWNAEGRIQGCSDHAVLTRYGKMQAQSTREMLASENFDSLIHSPLKRASQTADIIWGDRDGPKKELAYLREIDLYSLQGLLKREGKEKFGETYSEWQKNPWNFEIDNHAPVRELWYRASLAWGDILCEDDSGSTVLVVAHNAVNQALICTALGLAPTCFRRLLQTNAATTVLDFQPGEHGAPPKVTLNRLNQSSDPPFRASGAGRPTKTRLVLMRNGGTESSEQGLILGQKDESSSTLGDVHAQKTAELLLDLKCDDILCSPMVRAQESAELIAKYQPLVGHDRPSIYIWDALLPWDAGEWIAKPIVEVRGEEFPEGGEPFPEFWERVEGAWSRLLEFMDKDEEYVAVVSSHALVLGGLMGCCLGLDRRSINMFRHDLGSVTVIDFPDGPRTGCGIVRCSNYSAHLGRWAVPVTLDDWESVCGLDGCF